MSKRSVTEVQTASTSDSREAKKPFGAPRRQNDDEMGEFEDGWEDEFESDGEVVDAEAEAEAEAEDGMDIDEEVLPAIEETDEQQPAPDVFIPGLHKLGEDEVLEADESSYIMRHEMGVDWPCLSFDVLRDSLGDERQRYPATAYIVAGSQAQSGQGNNISVFKMSSLHKTQRNSEDSDSEDDDDEEVVDEDPIVESRSIPHVGGVNRVRAQPLPTMAPLPPVSQPYYVASWAETGKVHIWDVRPLIEALDVPGYTVPKHRINTPVFTITSHGRAEGFAMDWASSGGANPSALRILTGDVHSKIYLTTTITSGFNALAQPFVSHTSSVEDIQWSPTEATVFASCSADQSIQIWDVRSKGRKSVAGIQNAHPSDVNVISWNRSTAYLLLSGGDEGGINVWDLRNVKKKGTPEPDPTPVAALDFHRAPITAIEWHPTDESSFVASSADDTVTLWDLALEADAEQESTATNGDIPAPSQLLFQHAGQKEIKEVHWHPQMPGTVVSTSADGFNIFKTISI